MATVKEILVKISGTAAGLKNAVNDAGKAIGGFASQAGRVLTSLKGIAAGVFTAKITSDALQFGRALANVSTLVDTSKVNMAEMRQAILGMAGELGSATELTNAMYDALSAGIEPSKALEFVGTAARFAKAGLTDAKTATDAMTTVLNAYGMSADKAGKISDIMFKTVEKGKTTAEELSAKLGQVAGTAAATGVSFEDLSAAIATMTASGINTSESMTALKQVISGIVKPTADAEKVAAQLGIEFNSAALRSQGLVGMMQEIQKKAGGNTDAISKLFGSVEAFNAVAVMTSQQGGKKLQENLDTMQKSAGATQTAFDKVASDPAVRFEAALNKIGAALTDAVLPALNDMSSPEVLSGITDLVVVLGQAVSLLGNYASAYAEWQSMRKLETASVEDAEQAVQGLKDRRAELEKMLIGLSELSPLHAKYTKELEILTKVEDEAREKAKQYLAQMDGIPTKLETAKAVLWATNDAVREHRRELADVRGETQKTIAPIDAVNKAYQSSIAQYDKLTAAKKPAIEATEEEKKALKELEQLYLDNISAISAYRSKTLTLAEAQQAGKDAILRTAVAAKDAGYQIELTADETGSLANMQNDASQTSMSLVDALELINQAGASVVGMLNNMGVSTGGAIQGLQQLGTGVASAVTAIGTGNVAGAITGVTSAIGGLFKALKGKSGELKAINRITQGLGVSKEQKKAWEEEAKALKGTASAERVVNRHLAELIDTAKAGTPQFDKLIKMTRDMWAVYEWGKVPLSETVDSYTAAYKAITDQVMASGKLSKSYIDLIRQTEDLKAKGIELAEISAMQAELMQAGMEGYKAYLEGDFSDVAIGVFEDMIAEQKILADNSQIVNGVKGLEQALLSLSAAQTINADQFAQFGAAAQDGFAAMIEAGIPADIALKQIGPTLSRLIELSNLYGFSIDDATQALIDQAQEAGVSLEKQVDPMQQVADGVQELVALFKQLAGATGEIGDAFRGMGKSASDAFREAGDAAKTYGGLSKGFLPGEGGGDVPGFNLGGPGFASGGSFVVPSGFPHDTYPIRVSSGEHVQVTPASERGGATGGNARDIVINYNISVVGNGETELARMVGDVVKKNTVGVTDKVKAAIGR